MTYSDHALAYRAAGFAPIPVSGKSPVPAEATGWEGTVTDEKIADWCQSYWGARNIALRAEGWISIDVDHGYEYQTTDSTGKRVTAIKDGATQLAALEEVLGFLPSTITSTARGTDSPSRQHFYRVPADRNFLTKPAEDVEVVQRSHRYAVVWPSIHPDSSAIYQWYGYTGELLDTIPTLDMFEDLPPAWLEYLTTAPPAPHTGFVGSIKAWLDILPQGEPTPKVRQFIDSIPETDFDHDDMVKLVFRAVRLGAENHTGVHQAIDALYDAWTRPPYEPYGPAFITAVEGAIRKAGKPMAPMPPLLKMMDVTNEISPELFEMVIAKVEDRPAHRKRIMAAAYAAGLNDSQALTLAWNSAVGLLDQESMDAEQMWKEAQSVRVAPTLLPEPAPLVSKSALLSPEERELVDGYTWWGTQYLEWVRSRVDHFNAPYHEMARWAIISVIASSWGYVPMKDRPMHCSLYMVVPGPSTTGKSQAFGFVTDCLNAYFPKNETPNLGDLKKITAVALHKALIQRDGLPSFVHTDEAQAFLIEMADSKWHGTLMGDLADYYGGHVGAKQMMNDKEMSGITAATYLTTYMTGIDDQMSDAMDLSMWTSGLFYRFVWGIGDPRQQDTFVETQSLDGNAGEYDAMPKQWAAEWRAIRAQNEAIGGKYRMVPYDQDALERHSLLRRQMDGMLRSHPRYERVFIAALVRFANSIRKCATLIALIEASPTVTMRHELIAIEQAESWLTALVEMVDRTSESKFDRDVEEVYKYMSVKQRTESEVYRAFKPAEKVDRIFRQLEREKRIRRDGSEIVQVAA